MDFTSNMTSLKVNLTYKYPYFIIYIYYNIYFILSASNHLSIFYDLLDQTVRSYRKMSDVFDIRVNAKFVFRFEHEDAANWYYGAWNAVYPNTPIIVFAVRGRSTVKFFNI